MQINYILSLGRTNLQFVGISCPTRASMNPDSLSCRIQDALVIPQKGKPDKPVWLVGPNRFPQAAEKLWRLERSHTTWKFEKTLVGTCFHHPEKLFAKVASRRSRSPAGGLSTLRKEKWWRGHSWVQSVPILPLHHGDELHHTCITYITQSTSCTNAVPWQNTWTDN
jgi:hypothetical protein